MRLTFLMLPFAALTIVPLFAACSGGKSSPGSDGGVPLSPSGLDARPPNPTCKAPERPTGAPVSVTFEPAFQELHFDKPMGITQIPGDPSRFYVFQRGGSIVTFSASDPSHSTVACTVQNLNANGEGGLLGMAFHPQAKQNGQVFVSYTINGGSTGMESVVSRLTSTDGGLTFDSGSAKDILGPFEQPYTNHKGGDVHFGNDGYLYLSFGDGGSEDDPLGHGQNPNLFFSKILRIDVDGGDPYAIPAGNPFKNGGGEPTTFAYGLRNPFRFSIDRGSGDVWVGDVGQDAWEEIDAKVVAGGNYGWNTREGTHCYNPMSGCLTAGLIDPIFDYPHSVGRTVIGGVVYRGTAIPSLVGTYLFADFVAGTISSLTLEAATGKVVVTQLNTGGPSGAWVGFGEDDEGEVYVVDLGGPIYKVVPAGAAEPPSTFPDKLSKTGCVDPNDATKPAAGLIPYEPHSPLWSDSAEKERWLALPDGAKITIQPDGDFDLPIGTVLMKSFSMGGQRVETRLLVHHSDGDWAGYTYEWDPDGKDATLLPSNESKTLSSGQTWYYPSRAECLGCHTGAAGRTLGLEIGQLNSALFYPATQRAANQLNTFDHIGLFDAPLPAPVEDLVSYPKPGSTEGTVETRARSYLHANCSFCHRPNSVGGGNIDLRFATPLDATQTCGAAPQDGDQGVSGAEIIAPGDPSRSLLSVRPKKLGAGRMPPIATQVVDPTGTAAIDAWISGLEGCPP